MRSLPFLLLLASALLASGCRQQAGDGAAGTAGAVAEPPEPPPPPAPVEAPFEVVAITPAGERIPVAPDGATAVPPDARFEVTAPQAFRSVRIRLLDGADRLVPSTDELSIAQGTTARIAPVEPLAPGEGYRIVVDEPLGSSLRDIEDREWLGRSIRFLVAEPGSGSGGAAPSP